MSKLHDETDLMAIGKHCDVPHCHQLDFLPAKCDKCGMITCGEHISPRAHKCKNASQGDRRVPQCPVCQKLVRLQPGTDANDCVELHIRSGCTKLIASTGKSSSKRCRHPRCRVKPLRPIVCDQCHKGFCAGHRFPDEHHCNRTFPMAKVKTSARAIPCC